MALAGSAPRFAARLNKQAVPYGGIALTTVVEGLGVVLNALVPAAAFEIVLNLAALGIVASWGVIVLCQLALYRLAKRGELQRRAFRMIGAPYTGYLTLAFLVAVIVLMAFDSPVGTWTMASIIVIIPALVIGWYASRARINDIAAARDAADARHELSLVASAPEA